MPSDAPRLLLAVKRRDAVVEAVGRLLPGVPAVFLEETGPPDWGSIEAALLGSFAREARTWDPASAPKLRFVQRVFTGVDDLPFDRFPARVQIAGNVGGYAPFVAEHALALALAAARSLITAHAQAAVGILRPAPENRTLWGQTAVILGYGEIGRGIAARLKGFDVRIVGVNRSGEPAAGCDEMVPASRLRDALPLGTFVFDARPLTRSTQGSIGAPELRAMRPDAIFVNVGRAGTVDEEALYRHLVEHPKFRAALDVWWEEGFEAGKLPLRFPFLSLPNVVGTPHSAGYAPPVEEYALRTAVENLVRFFAGERPRHLVDRSEYAGLR
ncbi:MAG: NAD(P)-dependent oxidoreductase [Thermoplasmata archaeon]